MDTNANMFTENMLSETTTFAEYLEINGALDLVDQTEAAAAYLTYVLGQPSFGRPQVATLIEGIEQGEQTMSEDVLRSFGTLLREGKIQKIMRGQFALAGASRYHPHFIGAED
jgi:hypothetical protein